jgi:RimJ/RimL family protein N-acetyltransferase
MPRLDPPDPPLADGIVTLRAQRRDDAPEVIAACQDPEIPRWTTVPRGYHHGHWEQWLMLSRQDADAGTGLHLLIVDRDDRLLGSVGLHDVDRKHGYAQMGYWLAAHARGHGHAARAVRLLRDWGHAHLGLRRIECLVHPRNTASQRVAGAAGFAATGARRRPVRPVGAGDAEHLVFAWTADIRGAPGPDTPARRQW